VGGRRGSLEAAVIGILGTLLAQFLGSRAENGRYVRARREPRREEVHAAVNSFIWATQKSEQTIDDNDDWKAKSNAGHDMCVAYAQLALLAPDDLHNLC
jgi:hypothetical protein